MKMLLVPPILLVASAVGALLWALWRDRQRLRKLWDQHSDYLRTHPPISDEEFLRRCSPGTPPDVALRVREIVAEVSCVPADQISPDARFVDDLAMD